jgi:dimethylargininase
MLLAITRPVSSGIARCELTHLPRVPIDCDVARAQHDAYERALTSAGCRLIRLREEPDLPDSVFVEDAAVVLDELAVLTRPGAPTRRPEVDSVAGALAPHRLLARIAEPGTLDGGDVLAMGRTLYAGLSRRTNRAGIEQLTALAEDHGYVVRPVEVTGCLHLKSAATAVGPETLLVNPAWVDRGAFRTHRLIEADEREPHAANALWLGGQLLYPASFPRTRERLTRNGVAVTAVDISELQKAEGAVTCCSLVFRGRGETR